MHLTVNTAEIAAEVKKAIAEAIMPSIQTAEIAQLLEELKIEVRRSNAPWLDRQGAADYCQCSVGTIDNFANAGKLEKHWLGNSPRFRRDDLDALIEGREKRRKAA